MKPHSARRGSKHVAQLVPVARAAYSGRRSPILSLVALAVLSATSLFAGCGPSIDVYTTPEGYQGSRAERDDIYVDAVYMDDPEKGIEGVVRVIWWEVFNVTVQNRSDREITVPLSSFRLIDSDGRALEALPLDSVLNFRSLVIGELMGYQQRAIRRAFWRQSTVPPGGFAVGFVFFERKENLLPATLVLDPDPDAAEDEVPAYFPGTGRREEPEEEEAAEEPVGDGEEEEAAESEESDRTREAPAPSDDALEDIESLESDATSEPAGTQGEETPTTEGASNGE